MIVGVEANPDTVLKLMNGDRLLVCESPAEVAEKVRICRAEILRIALQFLGEEEAVHEIALRFITGPRLEPVDPRDDGNGHGGR